jgi:hypothetical protein
MRAFPEIDGKVNKFFLFAHNAARFDEIFIIKNLVNFCAETDTLNFIYKDGRFITIT